MSGYFGALMRSSGLPFAGLAPAAVHAEPIVTEVDEQRRAVATPPQTSEAASIPHQAIAPNPVADPAEHLAAPARPQPPAADAEARRAEAGLAGPDDVQSRGAAAPVAEVPAASTAPPTQPAEAPKPDLGQELVRAAMQWVAADPQHARTATQIIPPREPFVPSRDEGTRVIAAPPSLSQPPGDGGVEARAESPGVLVAIPAAQELTTHESFAPPALSIRPDRQAAAVPSMPVAPPSREEVVEVSIGAIHVRVDAPAAQTVARPAASQPAVAPRAAASPPARSALARRALRRI